jgi:hypothetical protein
MRRIAVWTGVLVTLVCSDPARAALIVHIGGGAEQDALFWVETRSHYALIHGGYAKDLDARFMHPGETAKIAVWAVNPITFSFVSTSIYHPAYIYDSEMVKAMPSVLRTVTMPAFEPRSWRDFIDSGETVRHAGEGIHLGNVIDHFKLFIDPYLPARDVSGTGDRLREYIPLFEALIRHTELTLPHTNYGMKSIDDRRQTDPAYARQLDETEQGRLKELRDLLSEIKALLALSAEDRIRLRSLQAKLVNAGSVYHDLMTAEDRQRIEAFLTLQFEDIRSHPRPERTHRWFGKGTTILYAISLGDRYSLHDREGKRRDDDCYRTGLSVDLYGGEKTDLKNMRKTFDSDFCRNEKEEWVIRVPGR